MHTYMHAALDRVAHGVRDRVDSLEGVERHLAAAAAASESSSSSSSSIVRHGALLLLPLLL